MAEPALDRPQWSLSIHLCKYRYLIKSASSEGWLLPTKLTRHWFINLSLNANLLGERRLVTGSGHCRPLVGSILRRPVVSPEVSWMNTGLELGEVPLGRSRRALFPHYRYFDLRKWVFHWKSALFCQAALGTLTLSVTRYVYLLIMMEDSTWLLTITTDNHNYLRVSFQLDVSGTFWEGLSASWWAWEDTFISALLT